MTQTFSRLASMFNLFQRYHLYSSIVIQQLGLIETLGSVIKTINDRRTQSEQINLTADGLYIIFDLSYEIQRIISRDKIYDDDYIRADEKCQKLFGDKTESEVIEFLNDRIVQMRSLIDEALIK